jgi:hypothetical protein
VKKLLLIVVAFYLMDCGYFSPTSPSELEGIRLKSNLGFTIQAHKEYRDPGEGVTQAHADLADQYWSELMICLRDGMGYTRDVDPNSLPTSYVGIILRQPRGEHEYIYCNNFSGLQGACYHNSNTTMEVPGNYPTTTLTERPVSQPLKHEMLHYWYYKTRGHNGRKNGKHFWPAPNGSGKNVWDCTWSRGMSTMTHKQYLELHFFESQHVGEIH